MRSKSASVAWIQSGTVIGADGFGYANERGE